jgi:phosphatidate cytidylyltransferase
LEAAAANSNPTRETGGDGPRARENDPPTGTVAQVEIDLPERDDALVADATGRADAATVSPADPAEPDGAQTGASAPAADSDVDVVSTSGPADAGGTAASPGNASEADAVGDAVVASAVGPAADAASGRGEASGAEVFPVDGSGGDAVGHAAVASAVDRAADAASGRGEASGAEVFPAGASEANAAGDAVSESAVDSGADVASGGEKVAGAASLVRGSEADDVEAGASGQDGRGGGDPDGGANGTSGVSARGEAAGAGGGRKPSGGRAGRNLPAAIAVGVALGGVTLASLYVVKVLFLLVVAAAVGVGMVELARAFGTKGIQVPIVPLLGGMLTMVIGTYWGGPVFLVGTFTLTLMVTLVWRMLAPPGDAKGVVAGTAGYVRDATASAFICAYPALIAGFVPLLLKEDDGAHRVVVFIAVTICSDIGGYVAGVLFGKHKMSPIISPKKTWEGFAGSALSCVICGALLMRFLIGGELWQGAVIGAVVVVFATLGDLIESVIKRDLGIKDMGNLLPGHGGLMDRLDSLLFTLVPVWLLLSLFA